MSARHVYPARRVARPVTGRGPTPRRNANISDVRKMIKQNNKNIQELKFHNVSTVFSGLVDLNGSLEDMTVIARGDADTNRDGDRLLPKSLRISYTMFGETFSSIFRVIVFRWKPASVPTVGSILFNTGSGYIVDSDYQHDQRNQFEILYDKKHTVSNNGGSELVTVTRTLRMAKKQIDYTGGGTTGSNKIYVIAMTDRSLATSGTIQMVYRLNFTDS